MSFDLKLFSGKLARCRNHLQLRFEEISSKTGIASDRLTALESGDTTPSGDEILILADFFKQDYQFFISNEQKSASEQVDILYRKFSSEISKKDRWAIQEFIYLCECEEFLVNAIDSKKEKFKFSPSGQFYKQQGIDGAIKLREFLKIDQAAAITDLYYKIRQAGFHLFRRRLENSSISGLMINHPSAGQCILVNYDEDIFRQNFTVAHETAHAIFDNSESVNVSFQNENLKDLKEVRANSFASELLVPRALISKLSINNFEADDIHDLSLKLKVNPQVLLIALKNNRIITPELFDKLKMVKIARVKKIDSELSGLSERVVLSRRELLERGLSVSYVRICHDAYRNGLISANRMAEMLMVSQSELQGLLGLFNLSLTV